ncbi:hypothetical protein ACOZ4I_11255 [Haloarcula salina]|uniref:hypothetical protein n=1 Tax=Haloarcula salina TaxID=1429914 RepID=UPI003C6F7032
MTSTVASRVTVSVAPAEGDDPWEHVDTEWLLGELRKDTYETYLKRAHDGRVAVGEEWDEFVNCGCATPQDVLLRVERVEGGDAIGEETTLTIEVREAETARSVPSASE